MTKKSVYRVVVGKPYRGSRVELRAHLKDKKVGSLLASVGYPNFEKDNLRALIGFANQHLDTCIVLANAGLQTYGKMLDTDERFPNAYAAKVAEGEIWIKYFASEVEELDKRLAAIEYVLRKNPFISEEDRTQSLPRCTFIIIPWDRWEKHPEFKVREAIIRELCERSDAFRGESEQLMLQAEDCKQKGDFAKAREYESIAETFKLASQFQKALEQSSQEYAKRHPRNNSEGSWDYFIQTSSIYLKKECAAMSLWPACDMFYPGKPTKVLKLIEALSNRGFFEKGVFFENGALIKNLSHVAQGAQGPQLQWWPLKLQSREISNPGFVLTNFGQPQVTGSYLDTGVLCFSKGAFRNVESQLRSTGKYSVVVDNAELLERTKPDKIVEKVNFRPELLANQAVDKSVVDAQVRPRRHSWTYGMMFSDAYNDTKRADAGTQFLRGVAAEMHTFARR